MSKLIFKYEHFDNILEGIDLPQDRCLEHRFPKFRQPEDAKCFRITFTPNGPHLTLSYYIGVDWIVEHEKAIYVEPKLNEKGPLTNYLEMLLQALKHPGISKFSNELFEIRFDKPSIEIEQHQDLLTPLLIIQYLTIVHSIVQKGLKKSFYKVENNLTGRIKGKILQGQTIKRDLFSNKILRTYCSYEEFGYDSIENRLLKRALLFVQRYLPGLKTPGIETYSRKMFNYVMPAFSSVSDNIDLNEIRHFKTNVFYKEYEQATQLANLILKRFGYNITSAEQKGKVKVPPFWIDMSKLFELYVLSLLREQFTTKELSYHFSANSQELDYLLNTESLKFVIDAKYRLKYIDGYHVEDIRQISGYARMKLVYKTLNLPEDKIIPCLIIYPDQIKGFEKIDPEKLKKDEISEFNQFYKLAIKLPTIAY